METGDRAQIGAGIKVKGEIIGEEDLYVGGNVEGSILVGGHRLVVAQTAQIEGDAVAREILVFGRIKGNLRASDLIQIHKEASVTGDLITSKLFIEDGAYLNGAIDANGMKPSIGADLGNSGALRETGLKDVRKPSS